MQILEFLGNVVGTVLLGMFVVFLLNALPALLARFLNLFGKRR